MNMSTNVFSFTRILQALYYIQSKAPSNNPYRFDILYLLKMIFFSDRYHLRNYGITATSDNYHAMRRGPVASVTFNLLKGLYEKHLQDVQAIDEYNVKIKPQEKNELSKSFKEAMDFALKEFGDFDKEKISEISHLYPEWKKHEKKLMRFAKSARMNEIDFFKNPDDSCFAKFGKKCDPFKEEDEEFLAIQKEHYHANHASR